MASFSKIVANRTQVRPYTFRFLSCLISRFFQSRNLAFQFFLCFGGRRLCQPLGFFLNLQSRTGQSSIGFLDIHAQPLGFPGQCLGSLISCRFKLQSGFLKGLAQF